MKAGDLLAIDIFSGAGGLSEGLRLAGFRVCLAVESGVDPHSTYAMNHPGTETLQIPIQEIKSFESKLNLLGYKKKEIDLVAGGPPCQGFSIANTRTRGAKNGHSKLIRQFFRTVDEIRPYTFLMENVPGMDGLNEGRVINRLISRFESIGYNVSKMRLTASDYGVPQHRSRIFIVGCQGSKISEPEKSHGPNGRKGYVTVKKAIIGDLPPLRNKCGSREMEYIGPARNGYQRWIREGCSILHDHKTTECGSDVKKRLRLIKQGRNLRSLMDEGKIPKELLIRIDHGGVYRRLELDQPSITIVNFRKAMIIHPVENRLLTIREAARLQSFQDRYRFSGRIGAMQQVIGDSVPPLLAKALAGQIRTQLLLH